ncbi:MAG TPA: PfkB family carbohydrate kinase, partial [Candidatus Paceibacterota bacterium]|nr:PfkB family carbohydrate kinase [Candidatus Paceibacterota bacterium]
MRNNILVSGSLTYDTIFGLQGKIKEQIVLDNGKLGNQSLMFTGREKQVYFGGTGGNIAYGLGKLGIPSFLVSVVGQDFDIFEKHLKKLGVKLRVKKVKDQYCSTFYAMTDENGEQIGVYQGGCSDKHL